MSDLRALSQDRGLRSYSKLRKADLISLLRCHDASTRTSMAQKQFDPEELDNEDKVNPSSDDPTITEEGTQFYSEDEE